MSNHYPVTQATAQIALTYLDSTERTLWIKIGQALKSEFGDTGFDLFDQWSQKAPNYDAKASKTTWRGIKANGSVTIGTLIYEAQQCGFDPKTQASNTNRAELTTQARAQQALVRMERDKINAQNIAAEQKAAAQRAQAEWGKAQPSANSPYLGIKGVAAHGLRFEVRSDGITILVPLRDNDDHLWNIQRIGSDGTKRFMKVARVTGLYHVIGEISQATEWLLIAEGYVTAATLHETTGNTVIVAFNTTNLKPVCAALRAKYPTIKLLVCADNDAETEQHTGKNTGILAAQAAAQTVGCTVVYPKGLPMDKSDFNDLANHPNPSDGLEQVSIQVTTAMSGFQQPMNKPPQSTKTETSRPKSGRGANGQYAGGGKSGFTVNDDGVFYNGLTNQGEPRPPLRICDTLCISANTFADEMRGQGYLLEFTDGRGVDKKWVMPARMLAGSGEAFRAELLDMGLRIEAGGEANKRLTQFIQSNKAAEWVHCTERAGWFGDAYVMPNGSINNEGDTRVLFQSETATQAQFEQKGTLKDWINYVATPCVGNIRMVFAISCAFAGVLLEPSDEQSGGFHFWGDGSIGKSTALYLASSVFGSRDYLKTWRATDTALETTAAQFSDSLLVLDEIGQVDGKIVGDVVYMLGNERGKMRGLRTGGSRPTLTWRIIFLSTGEKQLSAMMKEAGKTTKAGQETRLVQLKGDAGVGFGMYDTLNGYPDGEALAKHLNYASNDYYGVAGYRFIEHVVSQIKDLRDNLRYEVQDLAADWTPQGAHGQVSRVAQRFALVGLAGEMATEAGLTGWAKDEAKRAAKALFDSWIDERGGAGNSEVAAMLEQVRGFFAYYGESRFTWWSRALDDHSPSTGNRAGFRRLIKDGSNYEPPTDEIPYATKDAAEFQVEYYVLPEVFKNEVCKGFEHKAVAKLLLEMGIIRGDGAGYQRAERLPLMGKTRCYRFTTKLFEAYTE